MKKIKLTQGKYALVDDEDFERLNKHKWYALKQKHNYYAVRDVWNPLTKKKRSIRMHREVMNVIDIKVQIDHKFHNGLDNRKKNLRIATNQQNSANRRKNKGTSKYLGVSFKPYKIVKNRIVIKNIERWVAYLKFNQKQIFYKSFKTEEEAALAYNEVAIKYFGEFANLNKIEK